jgi:fructose-1,6-bisphosphatase/inositol monophosphatase family enzyme
MAENRKLHEIMDAFERAFIESREHLFNEIAVNPWKSEARRSGDIRSKLDGDVYENYKHVAQQYKMLIFCEEDYAEIENMNLHEYDYLLILDPIDGTVNMFSNLPFGVNIGFGSIVPEQHDFKIKNIEGVFVGDYLSRKIFKWIYGSDPQVIPPQFDGRAFQKSKRERAFVYEVPDESSYLDMDAQSARRQQEELLGLFRYVFPKAQRRAIDCTGLRMLDIADGNLLAYGDLRGEARIWDTVPSIKFLMEMKRGYHILDATFQPYDNNSVIIGIGINGHVRINNDLGKGIIVIQDRDYEKMSRQLRSKRVFIVHGRDTITAEIIARCIKGSLSLDCTILGEKANEGLTLIEKLEKYSDAEYAVVLLTGDDEGRLIGSGGQLKPRARQNIIFEMGLFYGLIGRSKVITLHKGDVELPSDIEGILYVRMDDGEEWKAKLTREISRLVRGDV